MCRRAVSRRVETHGLGEMNMEYRNWGDMRRTGGGGTSL